MLFLGFDTGGTYTDAVIFDPGASQVLAAAKSLTTKHDLAIGLRKAMELVLPAANREISLVSLSTTLATNALVEGQGSPICLLLIGYDQGSLKRADLGRALGTDPVVFIAGGHNATGDEQTPLDREALEAAVREHGSKVASFAVSSFFSVRNPAHELAARELIREITGLPVTCGHELTSKLDAPRRALTTALNARLIPQLQHLIRAVEGLMREKGIAAPLMVVKGDGSLVSAEFALNRPVETILSGPAASVVGARHLSGEGDVLVSDMGGTTTDVALLRDGRPILDRNGATVGGWKTMVEAVAVHTFGLGGDSEIRREGQPAGGGAAPAGAIEPAGAGKSSRSGRFARATGGGAPAAASRPLRAAQPHDGCRAGESEPVPGGIVEHAGRRAAAVVADRPALCVAEGR